MLPNKLQVGEEDKIVVLSVCLNTNVIFHFSVQKYQILLNFNNNLIKRCIVKIGSNTD